jgi:hypothetical protein
MTKPIAYAKHPLAISEKEKLVSEGFKVLDIKFKPEKMGGKDIVHGEKANPKPKPKPKSKTE